MHLKSAWNGKIPKTKCISCGHVPHHQRSIYRVVVYERIFLVDNVPEYACPHCGTTYFYAPAARSAEMQVLQKLEDRGEKKMLLRTIESWDILIPTRLKMRE